MNTEDQRKTLRWYHLRRYGLTVEYYGGIIAGFGLGIIVGSTLLIKIIEYKHIGIIVPGLMLMAIGSSMARYTQKRHAKD